MIIKRDLYLNKLIERKHNGLIKVITRIRRCGKSFLLFKLFKNHLISKGVKEDHIIELNFEDFENERNNFLSSQEVTDFITRSAATSLLTKILQSSAYLTKCRPLISNSLSNLSK